MKKILFILLSILIIGGLLSNTSCRAVEEIIYSLTGTWWFDLSFAGGGTDSVQITCTGGVAYDDTNFGVGSYTDFGSSFNISITWSSFWCGTCTDTYSGTFVDTYTLSGNFSWVCTGCFTETGSLWATRL